jgi:hypothetical protein
VFARENFKSEEREIDFFKNIKPQFTSKFIYYNTIYKIEAKIPHGGDDIVKKYLNKELKKLKKYFDNNLDFYGYHRTGNNYLDFKYFIRGNFDIKLTLDCSYFDSDHNFCTSHDFKVAMIFANDLIQIYLENKLLLMDKIEPIAKTQLEHNAKQNWTGSKVALIELLYALHSNGDFNNGASDLKDIVAYFETVLSIDLGQYRRVFLEIRGRKSENTKYLNTLKDTLKKRIDTID